MTYKIIWVLKTTDHISSIYKLYHAESSENILKDVDRWKSLNCWLQYKLCENECLPDSITCQTLPPFYCSSERVFSKKINYICYIGSAKFTEWNALILVRRKQPWGISLLTQTALQLCSAEVFIMVTILKEHMGEGRMEVSSQSSLSLFIFNGKKILYIYAN